MMDKLKLARTIRKYLRRYLIEDEYFNKLSDNDKLYVYSLLNRILHILYLQLKHPGIIPLLFVHHPKAKQIIKRQFDIISYKLPFVDDISVVIIN